jgi:hypothetical protein
MRLEVKNQPHGAKPLSDRWLNLQYKAAASDGTDARQTNVKVRDGNNLYLVVRPGGGASWILDYGFGDHPLECSRSGSTPQRAEGRVECGQKTARSEVAKGQIPSKPEVKKAAPVIQKEDTVRSLFEDWMERHSGKHRVQRPTSSCAFTKDILPQIGSMHPAAVKRSDIMMILREIEGRGSHESGASRPPLASPQVRNSGRTMSAARSRRARSRPAT